MQIIRLLAYFIFILLLIGKAKADSPGMVCKQVTLTVCPGEKAVVVKKTKKRKKAKKPAEKVEPVKQTVVVKETVDKTRKNVIFVYGQNKITDLDVSTSNGTGSKSAHVESVRGATVGIGYQRLFDSGLVLGAGIDTAADVQIQAGLSW